MNIYLLDFFRAVGYAVTIAVCGKRVKPQSNLVTVVYGIIVCIRFFGLCAIYENLVIIGKFVAVGIFKN